jgi:hypothetical protein
VGDPAKGGSGGSPARPSLGASPQRDSWEDPRGVWASHLTARRVLELVVPALEKAGVPALVAKGVVTAQTLYDDAAQRPIGDIDLKVRPEDLSSAARIAREEGWSIVEWKPAYGSFVFFVEELAVSVDVEAYVGPPGMCALTVADMLSRAQRWEPGAGVFIPEIHDHAVLLCVNTFKDKLSMAFSWSLEDVVRIAVAKEFDPGRFVERARSAKVACLAWIVADWMAREKKSEAWSEIRKRLGGDHPPRELYARAFRRVSRVAPEGLVARVLARIAADDPRMWGLSLWRAALWEAGLGGWK